MSRHQGKVRWFNEIKGYGFIEDQNGGDVFVHASQIIIHGYKKLSQGETVYFDLKEIHKFEPNNLIFNFFDRKIDFEFLKTKKYVLYYKNCTINNFIHYFE